MMIPIFVFGGIFMLMIALPEMGWGGAIMVAILLIIAHISSYFPIKKTDKDFSLPVSQHKPPL